MDRYLTSLLRLRLRARLRRDRGAGGPRRPEVHLGARGLARAVGPALLRAADLQPDAPRQARQAASRSRSRSASQRQARRHPDPPADRRARPQDQGPGPGAGEGDRAELVSERIGELRGEKEALEEALAGIGAEPQEAEDEELAAQLARLPDLGEALREAPPAIKRQVFESFDLQIVYDKVERRVELSATVSEAVADAGFGRPS